MIGSEGQPGPRTGFGTESSRTYAIIEVQQFAAFRRLIGTADANAVMGELRQRLERALPDCVVGRVGRVTIEFALPQVSRAVTAEALARAARSLEARVWASGAPFDPAIVIGVSRQTHDEPEESLLDAAAAALDVARLTGAAICWAEDTDAEAPLADLTMMRDLAAAIAADALDLHYQPKLDTRTNRIVAAEALLRWPGRPGPVDIERLIRLSEQTGLIRDLTDWTLERALRDQAAFARAGHDLRVDVNLSCAVLPDSGFARRAIARIGTPARIGFEITETAIVADSDSALRNLHAFAQAGIHIAIDDYGSGLSSLAYLKQLPAQEMKIDRMFVSGLVNSHRDPLLVRSSIDLAHALEMKITAEGVDDAMALSLLRVMGCDLAQGYLISPPLPAATLVAFLDDDTRLAGFQQSALVAQLGALLKQAG